MLFLRKFKIKPEWRPFLATFALLAVSACTGKSDSPFTHKMGLETAQSDPNPADLTAKILPDTSVAALQGNVKSLSYRPIEEVIQPLRQSFFNIGILTNAQYQGTQQEELLRIYNKAILDFAAHANTPEDKERLGEILKEYEAFVTLGCDPKDDSQCQLVKIFREVANSWDVWSLIIDTPSTGIAQKEKRVRFGWKLINERENRSANLRYLSIAQEIEADLEKHPNRDREEMHFAFIERILRNSDSIKDTAEFVNYLRYLVASESDPRKASRRQQVRQYVMLSKSDGALLQQDWFIEGMRKSSAKNPLNFDVRLKIISEHAKNSLKNFGIRTDLERDGLFFLLDNVYTGEWSVNTAYSLWQREKPNSEEKNKMHQLMIDYVRTSFMATVVESNHRMGRFYADRKNFDSSTLHSEAYAFSHELHSKWLDTFSRISRLRNLAIMIYGNGTPEMQSLRMDQDTLNESVAFLVSYPYMMFMVYEMVKYKFKIQGWFRNVDYTQVVSWIFEGKMEESWFDFTIEGSSLMLFTPTDLLYAFYFALKTDAFESMGIDVDDFVNTIGVELLKGARGGELDFSVWGLNDARKHLDMPKRAYAAEWNTALQFCKEEKQFDQLLKTNPQAARSFQRSYMLDVPVERAHSGLIPESQMGNKLFEDAPMGTMGIARRHSPVKSDPTLRQLRYFSDVQLAIMEGLRVSMGERERFIEDMLEIYKKHLSVLDTAWGAAGRISDRIAKAGKSLENARNEVRQVYTSMFEITREFTLNCVPFIVRKELDYQNALIRYEYEFYKQAYSDFLKLSELSKNIPEGMNIYQSSDPAIRSILSRYEAKGFSKDKFRGFDRFHIKEKMFEGFRLDAMIRFNRYLTEGLKTEYVNLPPINPNIQIIFPNGGLKDLNIYQDPDAYQMYFSGVKNADEFAARSIKSMVQDEAGSGTDPFVEFNTHAYFWMGNFVREYFDFFLGLLKTGEVEVYADSGSICMDDNTNSNCKKKKESISGAEIVNTMFTLYELFSGNDEDQKIFKMLGITGRGPLKNYPIPTEDGHVYWADWGAGMLFNPFTRERLGFFDYAYLSMANISLAYGKLLPWSFLYSSQQLKDPQLTVLERGHQLYKLASSQDMFLFKVDADVREYLRVATAKRVQRHFNDPRIIEKLARETESSDKQAGIQRRYRASSRSGEWAEGFYLDPRIVEDQNTAENEFNRKTRALYLGDGSRFNESQSKK